VEAFDYPAAFFEPRLWPIERRRPDSAQVQAAVALLSDAKRPFIVAGGGVWYSDAHEELEAFSAALGAPVGETYVGKGAITASSWRSLGGVGVDGTRAANEVASKSDLVICVGTRLSDFVTGSQSLFKCPEVRFVSINIDPADAHKQAALAVVGDARAVLAELRRSLEEVRLPARGAYRAEAEAAARSWWAERDAATLPRLGEMLSGAQILRVINDNARDGDVVVAAAGTVPGELQKLWDTTGGRRCHLEDGYSCMGYEMPGGLGARLARANGQVVVVVVGDGSFLLNPGELVTMVQERARVTVVLLDNHGYQVIHPLQVKRAGQDFGNEFRIRDTPLRLATTSHTGLASHPDDAIPSVALGSHIEVDFVAVAMGLGAATMALQSLEDLPGALAWAREQERPAVVVVPTAPQEWAPETGCWWDVAPAEVSQLAATRKARAAYEDEVLVQRRHYVAPSTPRKLQTVSAGKGVSA
jgi:3D-(3,5/4)-trihydroxycyclohexane-1,2-dione acylhydrolase (decyclizing)